MRLIEPGPPPAGSAPSEMDIRVAAAQETLERFRDVPLDWVKGDCGRICRFHVRALGLHIKGLAKAGSYRSPASARAALRRMGVEDMPGLLDLYFPRVAPAAARVGDFLAIRTDHPLGCITVYLGNGAVLGYPDDTQGACTARLEEVPLAAWRLLGNG